MSLELGREIYKIGRIQKSWEGDNGRNRTIKKKKETESPTNKWTTLSTLSLVVPLRGT